MNNKTISSRQGRFGNNLEEFLMNTTFDQPIKSSEEKSKNCKRYIIPKFSIQKVLYKDTIIGDLILDKGIQNDSVIISLEESELFLINKIISDFKNVIR